MAIAVDASTPARANGTFSGTTATTASFSPPDSVIVACTACNSTAGTGATFTMSNNGAALTWVPIFLRNRADASGLDGAAAGFYALVPGGRAGLTVTATSANTGVEPTVKAYVLTGVDTASVVGGQAEGSSSSTTAFTSTNFTIARDGSLLFCACSQFAKAAGQTSSDLTADTRTGTGMGAMSGFKALGAAGGSGNCNINPGGSPSTTDWGTFEIQASLAVPAPPPLTVPRARLIRASNF